MKTWWARALLTALLRLAAGRGPGGRFGLAVAVAVPPVALQQLLQVPDVADGGAQRLHLAEPLARQLARQVLAEARVALVHAAHALPLALVALAQRGGFADAPQRQGRARPSPRAVLGVLPRGAPARLPPGQRAQRRRPQRGR